jgi:hypothetical protein
MEINAYYRFEKEPENKTRYSLAAHNGNNIEYLNRAGKKGIIKIGFTDYSYCKAESERKTDYSISQCSKHISSVYFPSLENPTLAFGDFEMDCLLFIIQNGTIEILVFKKMKPFTNMLFTMLQSGEFEDEINCFRASGIIK